MFFFFAYETFPLRTSVEAFGAFVLLKQCSLCCGYLCLNLAECDGIAPRREVRRNAGNTPTGTTAIITVN